MLSESCQSALARMKSDSVEVDSALVAATSTISHLERCSADASCLTASYLSRPFATAHLPLEGKATRRACGISDRTLGELVWLGIRLGEWLQVDQSPGIGLSFR